ncbi:hypothetical protein CC2G_013374 [Coprinopsis cinerea AmutBmut pab1-1]|nr:hypothetical protein CC2G_013374 [Coprinopsis cinerea AmutBmut pab1-1]
MIELRNDGFSKSWQSGNSRNGQAHRFELFFLSNHHVGNVRNKFPAGASLVITFIPFRARFLVWIWKFFQ